MIGIYKIISPSKKIYIGQSINIEKRWIQYKNLHCKHQQKLYNSFIKYGFKKHKLEILQICEIEQLNELEKYYVDLFQTFNSKYGLNLDDGGNAKGKHSEETKLKIGLAHKGKIVSEESKIKMSLAKQNISIETRQKISSSLKGRKNSPESIRKTTLANIGRKNTEETKRKMSLAQKGRIKSKESIEKCAFANRKYILNIETGIFYHGSREAASVHCMNEGTLRHRLCGRDKNNTNLLYV